MGIFEDMQAAEKAEVAAELKDAADIIEISTRVSKLEKEVMQNTIDIAAISVPSTNHEPPGFVTIHDFDNRSQGAWLKTVGYGVPTGDAGPWTWVVDPDLNDTVLQMTYGPWSGNFHSAGAGYYSVPSTSGIRSYYCRFQVKLSAGFIPDPGSHDQKLFQFYTNTGGGYNHGTVWWGPSGSMRFMNYENNASQPDRNGVPLGQTGLPPGDLVVPPSEVTVAGVWHTFEILVGGNTPGSPDGWFQCWMDGRLQTQVNDMQWVDAGHPGNLFQFELDAIWGGGGVATLAQQQYIWVGPVHLSGRTIQLPHP